MQMESCDAFEEFAERVLSFSDLIEERGEFEKNTLRVSDEGSSDFDFEFGRAALTGHVSSNGGFLAQALWPEFKPDAHLSCSRSHENVRSRKSKANWTSTTTPKPPPPGGKRSPKWQFLRQILMPGLIAAPPMKLEDMRFRQVKPGYNNALESNIGLNRSLCWTCDADMEAKVLIFQQKSQSVKAIRRVEEMGKPKRSRMLRTILSLFGCTACMNSVVNCSTAKKQLLLMGNVIEPQTRRNIIVQIN